MLTASQDVPIAEGGDAAGGDAAGGDAAGPGRGGSFAWYGDSAYGTGELRGVIERAGDDAVIKPKPVTPAVPGGFTVDDFTVDEEAQTVTCPAGQTRPISPRRTVTFGALCRDCPLRARCTTAKTGRSMDLHERDDLLRAARADWAADPDLRADYRHYRPNIERTVAQVATQGGWRDQAALPRHQQEPRLAQTPHRRAQPAEPRRSRAVPQGRHLGPGHLTGSPRQPGADPGARNTRQSAKRASPVSAVVAPAADSPTHPAGSISPPPSGTGFFSAVLAMSWW